MDNSSRRRGTDRGMGKHVFSALPVAITLMTLVVGFAVAFTTVEGNVKTQSIRIKELKDNNQTIWPRLRGVEARAAIIDQKLAGIAKQQEAYMKRSSEDRRGIMQSLRDIQTQLRPRQ